MDRRGDDGTWSQYVYVWPGDNHLVYLVDLVANDVTRYGCVGCAEFVSGWHLVAHLVDLVGTRLR